MHKWTSSQSSAPDSPSSSFFRNFTSFFALAFGFSTIVDEPRGKEYIWYRKDFGTSFGWREGLPSIEKLRPPQ